MSLSGREPTIRLVGKWIEIHIHACYLPANSAAQEAVLFFTGLAI
jgi:hypothetical protein